MDASWRLATVRTLRSHAPRHSSPLTTPATKIVLTTLHAHCESSSWRPHAPRAARTHPIHGAFARVGPVPGRVSRNVPLLRPAVPLTRRARCPARLDVLDPGRAARARRGAAECDGRVRRGPGQPAELGLLLCLRAAACLTVAPSLVWLWSAPHPPCLRLWLSRVPPCCLSSGHCGGVPRPRPRPARAWPGLA